MTDWDRVQRLLGQSTLQNLASKTVGVVGLGSGGGYVAVALAMCGVNRFVLMDDDTLDPHNIVRHIADRRDIGRLKVDAVADLILARNPNAHIRRIAERFVGTDAQLSILDNLDVLVVGVDGEGTKYTLNAVCLEYNVTAVYAGVYERGEGGDVVVIKPHNGGPCYACWAKSLREGYITVAPDGSDDNLDYGQRRPDGGIDAEPGLWLDVVRVANTQANITLNLLLAETPAERILPANTVILANQAIEILEGRVTPPFSVEWVNIPRDEHCLICSSYYEQSIESETLSLDMLLQNDKSIEALNLAQEQETSRQDE